MTRIILSVCVAVSVLSFDARAQSTQDERHYADGPVTLVQEIAVEYGHFEDYIDWLNSTWKPTMEATKKAGIIIDYKVFGSTPPSPAHLVRTHVGDCNVLRTQHLPQIPYDLLRLNRKNLV